MFHVASIVTPLVGTIAQSATMPQCQYGPAESSWKWIIQSVVPVAGGTLIAVWSFLQNRRSEQHQWERNQKATREQWIRDQKVVEWKGLIELVAEYQRLMPAGEPGSSTANAVRTNVLPLCDRIAHSSARALLISPVLTDNGIRLMVFQIIQETDRAIGRIEIFPQSTQEEKISLGTPVDNAMAIRARLEELHSKLINLARQDLGLGEA